MKTKLITPKTWTELAKLLGVSRQKLCGHSKKPGAPKLSDYAGWELFLASVERDVGGSENVRRAIAQQRLRLIRGLADDRQRRNKKAAGELVELERACNAMHLAAETFWAELQTAHRDLPALCESRSADFIRSQLSKSLEQIKTRTQIAFEKLAAAHANDPD